MPSTSNSTFTPPSYSPPLRPLTPLPRSPLSPTSSPEPAATPLPTISPSRPSALPKTSTPPAAVLGHEAGPSVLRARGQKLELEVEVVEAPSLFLPRCSSHLEFEHEPAGQEVALTTDASASGLETAHPLKCRKAEDDQERRYHEHAEQDDHHGVVTSTSHTSVETLVERSSKRRKLRAEPSPGQFPTDDFVLEKRPNGGKLDVEVAPSPPAETNVGHPELPLLEAAECTPALGAVREELPTEILQHIFLDVIERTSDDKLAYSRKRLANLHSLSKVSQRWRNIVHGYPALWAKVLDPRERSRRTFDRVLRRSGSSAPLEISVGTVECASLCKRQWRDTLARMNRIAHLDIGLSGKRKQKGLEVLEDALGKEAPKLESLCITFDQDEGEADEGDLSVSLTPTPDDRLFAGYAPKLKRLSFVNCALVSVDAGLTGVLGNLVQLKIDNKLRDWLDLDHALLWWDLCRSGVLPLLESLSFRFLRRWKDSIPQPPSQDVRTPERRGALPPHLKFLSLEGELEPCISLLNLMDVPTSCSVHLVVEGDDPNRVGRDYGRTFEPQSEPMELVSSLSRLWKENTTPCLELEITVKWDETLRLSHRSAEREIEVTVEPSYVGENVEQMQAHGEVPWSILDFYRPFFDHLSRPEHLPDLSAEALLTLIIGVNSRGVPIVGSTFAKFVMQLRSVTRLRLMQLFPHVLVAGRSRQLFDLAPDDLNGPSILPSDTCNTLVVLPSVRYLRFPQRWLYTPDAEQLARFIGARCPPGENFTLVGEPDDDA